MKLQFLWLCYGHRRTSVKCIDFILRACKSFDFTLRARKMSLSTVFIAYANSLKIRLSAHLCGRSVLGGRSKRYREL